MFLKCQTCETQFNPEFGPCPKCGGKSGYNQNPSCYEIEGTNYHLEETLRHVKSNNLFQIKEIQTRGFVAVVKGSILPVKGKKAYIPFTLISEYERL